MRSPRQDGIVEAEGIAQFGYDRALNERVPLGVGWFGLELGRVQLLRGAASASALTSFRCRGERLRSRSIAAAGVVGVWRCGVRGGDDG